MAISQRVTRAAQSSQMLLWTCQRYDLRDGVEPHDLSQPAEAVSALYRSEPSDVDVALASLYWEATWFEGAQSAFQAAYTQLQRGGSVTRPAVLLARPDDARARILSAEFLSICCVNGVLEYAPSPDARYGFLPRRLRERAAWDLAARLKLYPERVLVVLGAQTASDVELLSTTAEDNPLRGAVFLLVGAGQEARAALEHLAVDVEVYDGQLFDLISELSAAGMQPAARSEGVRLRAGNTVVEIEASAVERVRRRFALVTQDLLTPPQTLDKERVLSFLNGDLDALPVYSSGLLPVKRAYRTDDGHDITLTSEILAARDRIQGGKARFVLLRLPAEGGSGATTLARHAAIEAALAGIPTLILKPGQVDVDIDEVAAFMVALTDACEVVGGAAPPVLLLFDSEHKANINPGLILRSLAVQGRGVIALEVAPIEPGEDSVPQRRPEWVTLPVLESGVREGEAGACRDAFASLRSQSGLDFLPDNSLDEWQRYESSVRYTGPSGTCAARSPFWVALRFFLVEGADFRTAEEIQNPLSAWIQKRRDDHVSGPAVALVDTVAALSVFRLQCPLSTALRVAYGGRYSTEALDTLRGLCDLIEWNDRSDDLEDQTLLFRHPDIAREYLAEEGVRTEQQTVAVLQPAIEALVDSAGDRWLAETLSATVLQRSAKNKRDFEWRLDAIEMIPPAIRGTSRTILHHRGRLQFLAARYADLTDADREDFLRSAVRNLVRAIEIEPDGRKQERPGLIFNTLGTAHWHLAEHLSRTGSPQQEIETEWLEAARCFEQSISQLPDNIEALLAYSYRLLTRAGVLGGVSGLQYESELERADGLGHALSLLDDAKDSMDDYISPDPEWQQSLEEYRLAAFTRLKSPEAGDVIEEVRARGDAALAEYLEARRFMLLEPGEEGEGRALEHLEESFDEERVFLDYRALRLMARLLSRLKPSEFTLAWRVYEALRRDSAYELSFVDRFRYAVLCYQTGKHDLGAEQFRRLRADLREVQSSTPPHVAHDFLRAKDAPASPAAVTLRVERVINPLRAYGYVDEIGQEIPVKPRQFPSNPGRGDVVTANVRFGMYGPYAVPPR